MLRRMNRVNQLISDAENFSAGRINHFHPPHPPPLIAHFEDGDCAMHSVYFIDSVVIQVVTLAMALFNDMVQLSCNSTPMHYEAILQ